MKAIRHSGLVVKDLSKMIRFYTNILGMNIVEETLEQGQYIDTLFAIEGIKVKIVKMAADNGNLIELLCFESHPSARVRKNIPDIGHSHISFTVEDIDREYTKLKAEGLEANSPPLLSPDSKVKVLYCRDPEGNFVELVQELS